MSTQLDHTWLPSSSRNPWDGTRENGPIDYGNGAYGHTYRSDSLFDSTLSLHARWYEEGGFVLSELWRKLRDISINIFHIVDGYTKWRASASQWILQIYADEKIKITSDDVLWFLRYEDTSSLASLLNESRYSSGVIQTYPRHGQKYIEPWVLPHTLIRAIKKSIDELQSIKK